MSSEREWIGISDLMSVLMMVFLFIAILFMLQVKNESHEVEQQHAAMRDIAKAYGDTQHSLHDALQEAFAGELEGWNAEVLADGTVRFNNPEVLFEIGSSALNSRFRTTLDKFFPRYVALLRSGDWHDEVDEIRIEGHTSSDWNAAIGGKGRYLHNAKLSQARAFSVLQHVYEHSAIAEGERVWLRKVLRATGVSFSKPILTTAGAEDYQRSRRVEFHANIRADEKLNDILQQAGR